MSSCDAKLQDLLVEIRVEQDGITAGVCENLGYRFSCLHSTDIWGVPASLPKPLQALSMTAVTFSFSQRIGNLHAKNPEPTWAICWGVARGGSGCGSEAKDRTRCFFSLYSSLVSPCTVTVEIFNGLTRQKGRSAASRCAILVGPRRMCLGQVHPRENKSHSLGVVAHTFSS